MVYDLHDLHELKRALLEDGWPRESIREYVRELREDEEELDEWVEWLLGDL